MFTNLDAASCIPDLETAKPELSHLWLSIGKERRLRLDDGYFLLDFSILIFIVQKQKVYEVSRPP